MRPRTLSTYRRYTNNCIYLSIYLSIYRRPWRLYISRRLRVMRNVTSTWILGCTECVRIVASESDMPYVYYVDSGLLFRMTVNQSMVQLVADVTSAAAAVSGHLAFYWRLYRSMMSRSHSVHIVLSFTIIVCGRRCRRLRSSGWEAVVEPRYQRSFTCSICQCPTVIVSFYSR